MRRARIVSITACSEGVAFLRKSDRHDLCLKIHRETGLWLLAKDMGGGSANWIDGVRFGNRVRLGALRTPPLAVVPPIADLTLRSSGKPADNTRRGSSWTASSPKLPVFGPGIARRFGRSKRRTDGARESRVASGRLHRGAMSRPPRRSSSRTRRLRVWATSSPGPET